jgi:hypothetical protein
MMGGSYGAMRDDSNNAAIGIGPGMLASKGRLSSFHGSSQDFYVKAVSVTCIVGVALRWISLYRANSRRFGE